MLRHLLHGVDALSAIVAVAVILALIFLYVLVTVDKGGTAGPS